MVHSSLRFFSSHPIAPTLLPMAWDWCLALRASSAMAPDWILQVGARGWSGRPLVNSRVTPTTVPTR